MKSPAELKTTFRERLQKCEGFRKTIQTCSQDNTNVFAFHQASSGISSFEVLKQCKSDFLAKIHEALLIKKDRLSLNKLLNAHGSFFLLNVCK